MNPPRAAPWLRAPSRCHARAQGAGHPTSPQPLTPTPCPAFPREILRFGARCLQGTGNFLPLLGGRAGRAMERQGPLASTAGGKAAAGGLGHGTGHVGHGNGTEDMDMGHAVQGRTRQDDLPLSPPPAPSPVTPARSCAYNEPPSAEVTAVTGATAEPGGRGTRLRLAGDTCSPPGFQIAGSLCTCGPLSAVITDVL